MQVAVYVRVSTSRQVKLQTIEQQLERVQRHVREKGWELPDENVFRDDGYSGTILGRPGLDALRDRARVRDLEVVVMLSPDRLARNGKSTRWSSSRSSRRTPAGWSLSRGR
jgi:site-specific DNA recombinase